MFFNQSIQTSDFKPRMRHLIYFHLCAMVEPKYKKFAAVCQNNYTFKVFANRSLATIGKYCLLFNSVRLRFKIEYII